MKLILTFFERVQKTKNFMRKHGMVITALLDSSNYYFEESQVRCWITKGMISETWLQIEVNRSLQAATWDTC
ncbi:hypothetical protein AS038_12240 [Arthrobacter sp. NIO-1057]|nr:hypothetical protein AS038_12240 [Arthrobacter sp. NIO-1057]